MFIEIDRNCIGFASGVLRGFVFCFWLLVALYKFYLSQACGFRGVGFAVGVLSTRV